MIESYYELDTCRPVHVGMGAAVPGLIPWTAISEYAARHGIHDTDEFSDFVALIRAIERAELAARKPTDAETPPPKAPKPRRTRRGTPHQDID